MKKNIMRFIVLILCSIILFNNAGCEKKDKHVELGGSAPVRSERIDFKGVHNFDASDSGKYIVKNGQSDYKIVYPSEGGSVLGIARNELRYFIKEATGINLIEISDIGLEHDDGQKYLSIGDTTLFTTSGIKKDDRLKHDGAQITTKGNTVFFIGAAPQGVLNSVYTFLELTLHFDAYWKDCYDIDRNVSEIKLMNYNVVDIPDVSLRDTASGPLNDISNDYDASNYANRLRYSVTGYPYMRVFKEFDNPSSVSATFHNSSECLPVETYGNEHPKWFGDGTIELCYTAHGDEKEFESMAQEAAKKMENSLKIFPREEYPEKSAIFISGEDGVSACGCPKCKELTQKYHTASGAVIIFINRVAELVEEWMNLPENEPYKRDDFNIIFSAYNDYELAPAKKNETTGKWEPIDEKVGMRHNTGVEFCPISCFDNQQSIYAKINKTGLDVMDAWGALTDSMYLWTYGTNFTHYMYMYDSFSFYNEAYKYIASKGAEYIFPQMQWDQKGASTAWHTLKVYLDGKCYWNSNLNPQELTDKYFRAMYKEAAPIMQSLFNEMRMHSAKVTADNDLFVLRSIYNEVAKRDMWPLMTLMRWMKKCDEAIDAISMYKDVDKKLYDSLAEHVEIEWLSPAYITLSLYHNQLSKEDKMEMITRFERIVNKLGITNLAESNAGLIHSFDGIK